MKKALSIVLLSSLILSTMTFPAVAAVDTTSSATPAATAPATPYTPAATPTTATPAVTAPANSIISTTSIPAGYVHTVVSGDVFWKIAKEHNLTIEQLAKLNPQVKNINRIYVGDKLIIKAAQVSPVVTTAPAKPATAAPAVATRKLYHGFGEAVNYRIRGEQKDNLNVTTASVIFDQDGKIVNLTWDVLEVSYTLFPGWMDPTLDQAGKDAFVAAIDDTWETKREEGYNYDMTHVIAKGAADNLTKKEWFEQLDYFEAYFKGKTVAEVEAWFEKYTDANGRPYKMAYPDKLTEEDKIVVSAFTADENAMLVDVTSSATMSLQDGHSHFMTALKEAYEAREEIK